MISVEIYAEGTEIALWNLFHSAVRQSCTRDYSQAQLQAWAPDEINLEKWSARINKIKPFVARVDGVIAGYADLQADGYIDHFFVSADYQRLGVGRALMRQILQKANGCGLSRLYSSVSLTALPFFSRYGFIVLKEQEVSIGGQLLKNLSMELRVESLR